MWNLISGKWSKENNIYMNIKDIFIIILNSIFTSLVIGYFVFNISYIEKSCNPLQEYCEIRGDYLSKDFISNQIEILILIFYGFKKQCI